MNKFFLKRQYCLLFIWFFCGFFILVFTSSATSEKNENDNSKISFMFSARHPLNLEIFENKVYPFVSKNKNRYYFKYVPEREMFFALNNKKTDSLYFEFEPNRKSSIKSFKNLKILNFLTNEKISFIDLKIINENKELIIKKNKKNKLVIAEKIQITTVYDSNDSNLLSEYVKQVKKNNYVTKYKPSIEIELDITQQSDEMDDSVCETIKNRIEKQISNTFKNKNIVDNYIKKQISESDNLLDTIKILEDYYEYLVREEDLKQKTNKNRYTNLNKKLWDNLTLINEQINNLDDIFTEIRTLNDLISSLESQKKTFCEKIRTKEKAIDSELQIFRGDLESQSTYGIFAVSIKNQGSFESTDEILLSIFRKIALDNLSNVYIKSETAIRNNKIIDDKINVIKTGIINMTGSKDVYIGYKQNKHTLAVKMVKFTPYKIFDKGMSQQSPIANPKIWFLKDNTDINAFFEEIQNFIVKNDIIEIKKTVKEMFNDAQNKQKLTSEERYKLASDIRKNIDNHKLNINEYNKNIKKVESQINDQKNKIPNSSKKLNNILSRIFNSLNKFNNLEQKVINMIKDGYDIKIYEFSYKTSGRSQKEYETFKQLSSEMFEKIYKKTHVVHKTIETTVINGLFMESNDYTLSLKRRFKYANLYFDVPPSSKYPYPYFAIVEIGVQIESPLFNRPYYSEKLKKILCEKLFKNNQEFGQYVNLSISDKCINLKNHNATNQIKKHNNVNIVNIQKDEKFIIKKNGLIFSLKFFLNHSDPVYNSLKADYIKFPQEFASEYLYRDIRNWRIPTIEEMKILLNTLPDSKKKYFVKEKVFVLKNNSIDFIEILDDYKIKSVSAISQDFINIILVAEEIK